MCSNAIVNKICGIYQARKERHFPTCSFLVVRLKLEKECMMEDNFIACDIDASDTDEECVLVVFN